MNECPYCGASALTLLRKLFLGPISPVDCIHCGQPVVLSVSPRSRLFAILFAGVVLVREPLGLPTIWLYVLVALVLLLSVAYQILYAPLAKPSAETKTSLERMQVGVLVAIGVLAALYALWTLVLKQLIT